MIGVAVNWKIERITDEAAWFDDYVQTVLATTAPPLPEPSRKIGACQVAWEEIDPGIVRITASGGSIDDRAWAEGILRDQLSFFGYERAQVYIDQPMERTSHWNDIMAKAKRLIQSGQVNVLRNGVNNVVGHVTGDHGEYNTEISRDDPGSRAITGWQCECPWDQYAFQRTRQWKKYEGRPCAHTLALYWSSLATPLDDYDPQMHGPMAPGQKMGPTGPAPPPGMGPPDATGGPPSPSMPPAPVPAQDPLAPPLAPPVGLGADVLPPSPMEQLQMQMPAQPGATPPGIPAPPNSVSVPGARPPTPSGPVQYPGGTYSRVAAEEYQNAEIVRLNKATYGLTVGREGATDAGRYVEVPKNSTGEVMGQDATTGWVEVNFPLKGGPMTSYHVQCFLEPSEISKTNSLPPGPMIKRHR